MCVVKKLMTVDSPSSSSSYPNPVRKRWGQEEEEGLRSEGNIPHFNRGILFLWCAGVEVHL
jgi:hypothetical protein